MIRVAFRMPYTKSKPLNIKWRPTVRSNSLLAERLSLIGVLLAIFKLSFLAVQASRTSKDERHGVRGDVQGVQ